ncbi:unnamed protein product [Closterium sp. Yama58-4]|nr:unnamed protein product [Closterium sp. Yama58-4]
MVSVRVAADPRQQFTQYEIDELLSRISSGASTNAVDAIMASGAARHLAVRLLTGETVVDEPRPHSAAAGGRRTGTRSSNTARPAGPVPQSMSWEGPSGSSPSPRLSRTPRSPAARVNRLDSSNPAQLRMIDSASRTQPDAVSPPNSRTTYRTDSDPHSAVQRARSESPREMLESPRCATPPGVSSSEYPAEQVPRRKLSGRSFSAQAERPRSSGRIEGCRRGAECTSPGLISPLDLWRHGESGRAEHSSGAARAAQGEAGRVGDLRRNVLEKSLSDRPERPVTAAGRCGSGGRRLSSGLGRQTVGDERRRKGKEAGVWAVCDRLIAENDKSMTPREGGSGSPRADAGEPKRAGLKEVRGSDAREHNAHGDCCKAQEMLTRQVDGLTRQVEELTRHNAQLREMLQVRSGEVQRAEEALKVAQGERDALAQEMEAALHTWMAPTPRAATPRADVTNAGVTIEEHAAVVGRVAAVERENQELWAMLEGLSAQREAELRQTEGLRMRVKCMAAASGSPASTGKNGGGSPEGGASPSRGHGSNMTSVNRAPSASQLPGHRHQSSLHSVQSVPNPTIVSPSSPVNARRRFPTSASVPGPVHHHGHNNAKSRRPVVEGSTPSVGSRKKVWFGQD